jgi:hypothetical protein
MELNELQLAGRSKLLEFNQVLMVASNCSRLGLFPGCVCLRFSHLLCLASKGSKSATASASWSAESS